MFPDTISTAIMTLNLMLTDASAVYLSGDFRLTYKTGQWQDDFQAQKLVPVFKFGWSALVSFAGVAKTNKGLDVGDWVSAQTHLIGMKDSFDALPQKLLAANEWLDKLSNDRRLTFSIVGFVGRRPVAMVISNWADIDGNSYNSILPELRVSKIRPKKPEVRLAGDRSAVLPTEIDLLRKMLVLRISPLDMHKELGELNTLASSRSSAISRECITGHLLPTGRAGISPQGISDKIEYMPSFIRRRMLALGQTGFICKTDENGKALPPRWVRTWANRVVAGKEDLVGELYEFANIKEVISNGVPENPNFKSWWKIADGTEKELDILTHQSLKQIAGY